MLETLKKFTEEVRETLAAGQFVELPSAAMGKREVVITEITNPRLKAIITVVARHQRQLDLDLGTMSKKECEQAINEIHFLKELMWLNLFPLIGNEPTARFRAGWKIVRTPAHGLGLGSLLGPSHKVAA